jgi:hypothetical protein
MHIDLAIVPVAGQGTRLLPSTRSQPKEMLPVSRKPVVYVVEELVQSGIQRVLFGQSQSQYASTPKASGRSAGVRNPRALLRLCFNSTSARTQRQRICRVRRLVGEAHKKEPSVSSTEGHGGQRGMRHPRLHLYGSHSPNSRQSLLEDRCIWFTFGAIFPIPLGEPRF